MEQRTVSPHSSGPTVGNMYDKLIPAGFTGAGHLAAARPAPEVRDKPMKTWQANKDNVIEPHETPDLSDCQPTPRAQHLDA
jgi:(2R)-sulfolactate sulfo-lyase subunit beta